MSKRKKSKLRQFASKLMFFVIVNLINGLRLLITPTYRWRISGAEHRQAAKLLSPTGAYLLACWHETVFSVSIAQIGHPFRTLCSRSNSGQCVAYMMRRMGFVPVFGSQSSGGKAARDEILAALQDGYPTAITVDGSSGPRRFVKPGIIDLARKGKASILPVFTFPENTWVLNTWDRLRIPKPFSKIHLVYAPPYAISAETDTDYEEQQAALKTCLEGLETELKTRIIPATSASLKLG